MSCTFLNIRSIPSNLDEFLIEFTVSDESLDFMAFAETRLTDSTNSLYGVDGYTLFSNPRNSCGGGVCIYARNRYRATILNDVTFTSNIIETMFIKFKLNSRLYVIGCIYRPPSADVSLFLTEIERIMNYIQGNMRNVNINFTRRF